MLTCLMPLGAALTVLSLVESMRQLTSICSFSQAICSLWGNSAIIQPRRGGGGGEEKGGGGGGRGGEGEEKGGRGGGGGGEGGRGGGERLKDLLTRDLYKQVNVLAVCVGSLKHVPYREVLCIVS